MPVSVDNNTSLTGFDMQSGADVALPRQAVWASGVMYVLPTAVTYGEMLGQSGWNTSQLGTS